MRASLPELDEEFARQLFDEPFQLKAQEGRRDAAAWQIGFGRDVVDRCLRRFDRIVDAAFIFCECRKRSRRGLWRGLCLRQEDIEAVFFVEFVLHTTEDTAERRLAEGRRRLGYLKTLIELSFGPRVLGALLTEELGEVFPDGHFNRNLNSEQVGNEWQMDLAAVTADQIKEWARHPLGTLALRSPEDRERISLACDWYWRSTETADLVTEYLELWFVVEALAMPNTTDIRPVRERLAAAFGGDQADWGDLVGRHFGRRSKLVHGQARREIDESHVQGLRDLVLALLELEFGLENVERANQLRAVAGLPSA